MQRSPLFTLVIGIMAGLALGYVLAERQPVPPARALAGQNPPAATQGLPEGHPPVDGAPAPGANPELERQAQELQRLLVQSPEDPRLMVALGNLYFDAGRWTDARIWYERSLAIEGDDPNVMTDLAVVYRSLQQPERSLALLDRAIEMLPDHWQAWYNRVIVLHFDLHRHGEAQRALARLQAMARTNDQIPDLSGLEAEVFGLQGS